MGLKVGERLGFAVGFAIGLFVGLGVVGAGTAETVVRETRERMRRIRIGVCRNRERNEEEAFKETLAIPLSRMASQKIGNSDGENGWIWKGAGTLWRR